MPAPTPRARMARARMIAAALAAATLGVAGCTPPKLTVSSSPPPATATSRAAPAPAGAHSAKAAAPPPAGAAAGPATLLTEPGAGFTPVYRLIGRARRSIDMTMYELVDTAAEHDLAAAARRGVRVRVILDERERDHNSAAGQYLAARGVQVAWSAPRYTYTHQKSLVIDGATAVIMTANLTSRYYATSRDFAVIDSRPADVAAIERVFDADYSRTAVSPGRGADLVWSPGGSQGPLLGLISGATASLRVYSEEMADPVVEDALLRAAGRGVDVQLCGENADGEYDSAFARLALAGVHIRYYRSADGFYIHGKVIEADEGTSRGRAFIGSENFSVTSLDSNRELGLITAAPAVLSSIAASFGTDFRNGQHWP